MCHKLPHHEWAVIFRKLLIHHALMLIKEETVNACSAPKPNPAGEKRKSLIHKTTLLWFDTAIVYHLKFLPHAFVSKHDDIYLSGLCCNQWGVKCVLMRVILCLWNSSVRQDSSVGSVITVCLLPCVLIVFGSLTFVHWGHASLWACILFGLEPFLYRRLCVCVCVCV